MRLTIIVLHVALATFHGRDISVSAMQLPHDFPAFSSGHAGSSWPYEAHEAGSTGDEFSTLGKALLQKQKPPAAREFLQNSEQRFHEIGKKIDQSVRNRNLIYFEDGEGDDHWQSLLGAADKIVPQLVVLRGGNYKVRKILADRYWERFHKLAEKPKPRIMTIHGTTEDDDLGKFDKAEGRLELPVHELTALQAASKKHEDLSAAIEKTEKELVKRLKENQFTTIVVKCAPTGLAELILKAKAQKKVAIIWTGFMRYEPKDSTFQMKFNVLKDLEASKALLNLKLPTIITTPRLQNAKMRAIVPMESIHIYRRFFEDVDPDYMGFPYMHWLDPAPGSFAYTLTRTWDVNRDLHVQQAKAKEERVDALRSQENRTLAEAAELAKLEKLLTWIPGAKWGKILAAIDQDPRVPHGAPFRDLCPIDLYAHPILKQGIRDESVKEVIAADLTFNGQEGKDLVEVTPSPTSNVFIVSQFNSDPLAADIERSLLWMLAGEPLDRHS